MSEKDLDIAIEKCERIMEMDTRTMQNPVAENGWIFEKVYDLLKYLRQFQFATDTNVGGDLIDRQAAIDSVRKAKGKGEAHRMLIQLPSAQPGWIPVTERPPEESEQQRTGYLATVTRDGWARPRVVYVEWETTTVRGKKVSRWIWNDKLFPEYWSLVAWMPLPAPYRPEGENSERHDQ